jgi:hypothetical protein
MQYLLCFVFGVFLVAVPSRVSAQRGEPAPQEPALQLQLSDAGVEVAPTPPTPPRTVNGYTLEEMEVRVRRAKIGLGVSAFSIVVGSILAAGVGLPNITCTYPGDCPNPSWGMPVFATGVTLAAGGVLGMIATGALLGVRKRKLRFLQTGHHRRQREHYRPLR